MIIYGVSAEASIGDLFLAAWCRLADGGGADDHGAGHCASP